MKIIEIMKNLLLIIFLILIGSIIGMDIGSRSVKGYDVNLMHQRMEVNYEYNYCPYCGEYIGKE